MGNKYPYVPSAGPLVRTVQQFRKSFPKEVTAETLRKLGVAPQNESYVINILRFVGVIDDEGKKVDAKAKAFVQHQDSAFASEIEKIVREAYEELFELHGDAAWKLDRSSLIQFFRTTDHSSDVVGSRQAATFSALAALAGHAEVPTPKATGATKVSGGQERPKVPKPAGQKTIVPAIPAAGSNGNGGIQPGGNVGLTVRIEVNLPASGDQETYDKIFQSIRKNLIDAA